MKLFIASASNDHIPEKYLTDCNTYLEELFKQDNDLIFGSYNHGIMNLSYQKALKYNRKITGICPEQFKDDLKKLNCHKEIITNSISERTEKLIKESDVLIFLPGGIGTMQELFATIDGKRSKEFDKPIVIYNSCGFYDNLLLFLDNIYKENFIDKDAKCCYYVAKNAKDTLEYIKKYFN